MTTTQKCGSCQWYVYSSLAGESQCTLAANYGPANAGPYPLISVPVPEDFTCSNWIPLSARIQEFPGGYQAAYLMLSIPGIEDYLTDDQNKRLQDILDAGPPDTEDEVAEIKESKTIGDDTSTAVPNSEVTFREYVSIADALADRQPPDNRFFNIGLCEIDYLPTAIDIVKQTNFKSYPRLRDRGTDKINQGNVKSVLRIEFVVFGVDDLKILVRQFRNTPFVPINNYFINAVLGITDVALLSLNVNAIPKFPELYTCTLQLLPFDIYTIGWSANLLTSIDYDMYKWYLERFIPWKLSPEGQAAEGSSTPNVPDAGDTIVNIGLDKEGKHQILSMVKENELLDYAVPDLLDDKFDPPPGQDFVFEMIPEDFIKNLDEVMSMQKDALRQFYLDRPEMYESGALSDFDDLNDIAASLEGDLDGWLNGSLQRYVDIHKGLRLREKPDISDWWDLFHPTRAPFLLAEIASKYPSLCSEFNIHTIRGDAILQSNYFIRHWGPVERPVTAAVMAAYGVLETAWAFLFNPNAGVDRFIEYITESNPATGYVAAEDPYIQGLCGTILCDLHFGNRPLQQQLDGLLGLLIGLYIDAGEHKEIIDGNTELLQTFKELLSADYYRRHYVLFEMPDTEVLAYSAALENNFATIHTQSTKTTKPIYQHLGGGDVVINCKLRTASEDAVTRLHSIYEGTQYILKNYNHQLMMGFIGFRCRDISKLFQTREYIITGMTIKNVEGYPNLYDIDLQLIEYDLNQKFKAAPVSLLEDKSPRASGRKGVEHGAPDVTNMEEFDGRDAGHINTLYDSWWKIRKDTTYMSAYPDLVLPTNEELRRAGFVPGYADLQYMKYPLEYLDPDFYVIYDPRPLDTDGISVARELSFEGNLPVQETTSTTVKDVAESLGGSPNGPVEVEIHIPDKSASSSKTGGIKAEEIDQCGDPKRHFIDYEKYDVSNRLVQLFPTFHIILTQEFAVHFGYRVSDNLYGANRILGISVDRDSQSGQDTAEITLSNVHGGYQNPMADLATLHASDMSLIGQYDEALIGRLSDILQNISFATLWGVQKMHKDTIEILQSMSKQQDLTYDISNSIFLKPGHRVRISMGYGANPERLPVVFIGKITEVNGGGSQLRIISQGDTTEFLNMMNPKIIMRSKFWGFEHFSWKSRTTFDVWGRMFNLRGEPGFVNSFINRWFPQQRYYNPLGIQHFGLSAGPSRTEYQIEKDLIKLARLENMSPELLEAEIQIDSAKDKDVPEDTPWLAKVLIWLIKKEGDVAKFGDPHLPQGSEDYELIGNRGQLEKELAAIIDPNYEQARVKEWSGMGVTGLRNLLVRGYGEIFMNIYPPINLTLEGIEQLSTPDDDDEDKDIDEISNEEYYKRLEKLTQKLNLAPQSIHSWTVWDILKAYQRATPDYILCARPFENRSTLFYGLSRYDYCYEYYNPGADPNGLGIIPWTQSLTSQWHQDSDSIGGVATNKADVVVARFKPFMQVSLFADHNIVMNSVVATSRYLYNVAMPINNKEKGMPDTKVYVDASIVPSEQKITAIQTGIRTNMLENSWGGWLSGLGHWNYDDMVSISIGALQDYMREMYQGQVSVLGNTYVQPYDLVVLNDPDTGMTGVFEAGRVTTIFSADLGMHTAVKPNLLTCSFDPYKWSLINVLHNMGIRKIAAAEATTTIAANANLEFQNLLSLSLEKALDNPRSKYHGPLKGWSYGAIADIGISAAFPHFTVASLLRKLSFGKAVTSPATTFAERSLTVQTIKGTAAMPNKLWKFTSALWKGGSAIKGAAAGTKIATSVAQVTGGATTLGRVAAGVGQGVLKLNPVGVVITAVGVVGSAVLSSIIRRLSNLRCVSMCPLLLNCGEFSAGIDGHRGSVVGEVGSTLDPSITDAIDTASMFFMGDPKTISQFDSVQYPINFVRTACSDLHATLLPDESIRSEGWLFTDVFKAVDLLYDTAALSEIGGYAEGQIDKYKYIKRLTHPVKLLYLGTQESVIDVNMSVHTKFIKFLDLMGNKGYTSIPHLGVYNRRLMRDKSGNPIPGKWSPHSWYIAMDIQAHHSTELGKDIISSAKAAGFQQVLTYSWPNIHIGDSGPGSRVTPPQSGWFERS